MTPESLLRQWLADRLPADTLRWLDRQAECIRRDGRDADLYRAFSLAARQTGKQDLSLSARDRQAAAAVRPRWQPDGWRMDEAARLYLLLASAADGELFARRLEQLCVTADVAELVTLYRGLPLYPDPERYRLRAAEGVRTNMRTVLESVAHHNPYPAEQLPQAGWNQMVLKALFVGARLDPIIGLDERANRDLARMLCDYAHERWSAGRPVSPELWRCVGPFASGPMLNDLQRVLEQGTRTEQAAAMLALHHSPDTKAHALMQTLPSLSSVVTSGEFNWQSLAAAV
jgi:hypothetical protein